MDLVYRSKKVVSTLYIVSTLFTSMPGSYLTYLILRH